MIIRQKLFHYLELTPSQRVVKEHRYSRELSEKEIKRSVDGLPLLKKIEYRHPNYDPDTHVVDGFYYEIHDDKVLKVDKIRELNEEEKRKVHQKKIKDLRNEQLPPRDEMIEIFSRVLTEVVKVLYNMENPKDPRTKVTVPMTDYKKLEKIRELMETIKE